MATKIEFYERSKEHIPDEAARLIREEVPVESDLAKTRDIEKLGSLVENVELRIDSKIERLRSSLFRWNLTFFLPLWIGVYGTLIAVLLRG